MSKRKAQNSTQIENDFAVIETVRTNADVVVELVPSGWLKPVKKNIPIKVRESAKCCYPRHLNNQSKDQYLKHLQHAKFDCLKPKNDKKWDLLDCKVLKLGIGSFIDAVNAEKFFSDFFNTTDAEAAIAESAASPPKRLRKTKKQKKIESGESNSDDDEGVAAKVADIPNFNSIFQHLPHSSSATTGCSATDVSDPTNQVNRQTNKSNDTFDIRGGQLPSLIDLQELPEYVDDEASKTFTALHASSNNFHNGQIDGMEQNISPEEIEHEISADAIEQQITRDVVFEFIDQQQNSATKNNCNCFQKVINKMDYMQKKFLKELGRYRQETLQAISQFSDRYDVLLKSKEFDTPELSSQLANEAENDMFEIAFKRDFPNVNKLALIATNEKIGTERDFKKRLTAKLKLIVKEEKTDEVKVIRLIIKTICSSACLSDFTWLGTDKKENFSTLEALIGVIVTVVEFQFPGCDAFKTLKQVVQQRTKSAAEFEGKKKRLHGTAESNNSSVDTAPVLITDAPNTNAPNTNASPSGMDEPSHF